MANCVLKMSKDYDEHLKSDYWRTASMEAKKRDGFRCRLCNSQHDLCVHHRTYEHRGNELQHLDDLTTLCRRCHEIFHGVQRKPTEKPENEPELPEVFKITHKHIALLRSKRGGFKVAGLSVLGVGFPLVKGWKKNLLNRTVTRQKFLDAYRLRNGNTP